MDNTNSLFIDREPVTPVKLKGTVYIGTSGFSFNDWKGVFYPEKLPRRSWLEYYSSQFNVVEINATYYRLPKPETFKSMAERTPDTFKFWVKVPGEITHKKNEVAPVMKRFMEVVRPLMESGKFIGALAQFPNSFRPSDKSEKRIRKIQENMDEYPLAVELRNSDWAD